MKKFRVEENDGMDCPRVAYIDANDKPTAVKKFLEDSCDEEFTIEEIQESYDGTFYMLDILVEEVE